MFLFWIFIFFPRIFLFQISHSDFFSDFSGPSIPFSSQQTDDGDDFSVVHEDIRGRSRRYFDTPILDSSSRQPGHQSQASATRGPSGDSTTQGQPTAFGRQPVAASGRGSSNRSGAPPSSGYYFSNIFSSNFSALLAFRHFLRILFFVVLHLK